MNLKRVLSLVSITAIAIFYQNCDQNSDLQFASNCILGRTMQIEHILEDGTPTGKILNSKDIVAYSGIYSAEAQYNYTNRWDDEGNFRTTSDPAPRKPGAYPKVTPQPASKELKIMFYQDQDGLNFTFYVNDTESKTSANIFFDVYVKGNLLKDRAIVRDEMLNFRQGPYIADDLRRQDTTAPFYTANLTPGGYTDGGVIGPIEPGADFEMKLQFWNTEANFKKAMFHSADGTAYLLGDEANGPELTSFKITYKGYQNCTKAY
jgi:hypothetical protein